MSKGLVAIVMLTFRDPDGNLWKAAAGVGPLERTGQDGKARESVSITDRPDGHFKLTAAQVVVDQ